MSLLIKNNYIILHLCVEFFCFLSIFLKKLVNTRNGDFMGKDLLMVTVRAVLSLITLFLVTKMIGKKQVSQLSLFDYVIGISIGNFAAEMTVNLDSNILFGTIAVIIFGVVAYAISVLTMKSIHLRRYFTGIPTVLIEKGKLMEDAMRRVKFDVNDLLEQCRESGYFNISDINYAILESNGKVSFLPNDKKRPATIEELGVKPKRTGICANVIIDGNIMKENLKNSNKKESWLLNELKSKKIDYKDVLLATLDVDDKLNFYMKNKNTSDDVLE